MPRVYATEKSPYGAKAKQDRRPWGRRAAPCLSFPLTPTARPAPGGKAASWLGRRRRRRRRRKRRRAAPSRAHKAPFIGAEFGFPPPAQHLAASRPASNAAVGAGGWRVGRLRGHGGHSGGFSPRPDHPLDFPLLSAFNYTPNKSRFAGKRELCCSGAHLLPLLLPRFKP